MIQRNKGEDNLDETARPKKTNPISDHKTKH